MCQWSQNKTTCKTGASWRCPIQTKRCEAGTSGRYVTSGDVTSCSWYIFGTQCILRVWYLHILHSCLCLIPPSSRCIKKDFIILEWHILSLSCQIMILRPSALGSLVFPYNVAGFPLWVILHLILLQLCGDSVHNYDPAMLVCPAKVLPGTIWGWQHCPELRTGG